MNVFLKSLGEAYVESMKERIAAMFKQRVPKWVPDRAGRLRAKLHGLPASAAVRIDYTEERFDTEIDWEYVCAHMAESNGILGVMINVIKHRFRWMAGGSEMRTDHYLHVLDHWPRCMMCFRMELWWSQLFGPSGPSLHRMRLAQVVLNPRNRESTDCYFGEIYSPHDEVMYNGAWWDQDYDLPFEQEDRE